MKRNYSLDILRIYCCFCVVFMHSTSYITNTVAQDSIEWYVATVMEFFGFYAVPIFFMLSGYFMLDIKKECSLKYLINKIIHIITAFAFWSLVYVIYIYRLYLYPENINLVNIPIYWNTLFSGHFHFWYLFTLIGMYILTPVWKKVIEDKELTKAYLLFFFILYFCIMPIGKWCAPINNFYVFFKQCGFEKMFGYSVYYLLGGCLRNYKMELPKNLYKAGIVSMVIMITGNVLYSKATGSTERIFMEYLQPFIMIVAVAIFGFFLKMKIEDTKYDKLIKNLSANTFGVYLLHLIPYYLCCDYGVYSIPLPVPCVIIISSVINFVICNIVISLIRKIPKISSYIT